MPTADTPSRRRFALVALFLSLMLTIGVAEIGTRIVSPAPPVLFAADPVLGWRHVPGATGTYTGSIGHEFAVPVRINSHGFRDAERTVDKEPGTFRIALLGDSYVEALQVPFEATLPALLEQRLGTATHPVEVLNFGVSSYGTDQAALLLEHQVMNYQPDAVIYLFVANDVRNNSTELERLVSGHAPPIKPHFMLSEAPVALAGPSGPADLMTTSLCTPETNVLVPLDFVPERDPGGLMAGLKRTIKRSRLLTVTMGRLRTSRFGQQLGGAAPDLAAGGIHGGFPTDEWVYAASPPVEWEGAWHLTAALIARMRNTARAGGAAFILVGATDRERVMPGYWDDLLEQYPAMANVEWDRDRPSHQLARISEQQDIPLIDLVGVFRQAADAAGEPLHYRLDGHWTAAGHGLAADLLVGFLEVRL